MNPLHYPSLELCKKLTEAGWNTQTEKVRDFSGELQDFMYSFHTDDSFCPNVMEMLDVMPISVTDFQLKTHGIIGIDRYLDGNYCVRYTWTPAETNGTLPNALAEMILWLVENKHLSFDK